MAPAATAAPSEEAAAVLRAIQEKRKRLAEEESKKTLSYDYDDDEEDSSYAKHVPLKQRRLQELQKISAKRTTSPLPQQSASASTSSPSRRAEQDADEDKEEDDFFNKKAVLQGTKSLMAEARAIREAEDPAQTAKTQAEKEAEEERKILEAHAARKKLAGAAEIAKGIEYSESLKTSWTPPTFIRNRPESKNEEIREKLHILCDGADVPPVITNFRDMKLPACILDYLATKNIKKPSLIQMQGLPTAFSGRDMIGIAFTGSGKTLAFSLPIVMFALEEEAKMPYTKGEGPTGMIICPSRELARQTYEGIVALSEALVKGGYPEIRSLLCIGGISMAEQGPILQRGFHIVVATPGRLQDMLEKRKFTLESCKYLCMDEADRMIDMGFEDDVRNIMSFFTKQRQTLLFSATMPKKIQDFAEQSLIRPVIVNVGRAGAANLDVIQEVEYVKQEAKMVYLLECLQKTAPPVIIFSHDKNEVDDIQEYLLLKGVEAVAIHGSKTQDEREYAIKSFKTGQKDVMVASGVASKGLDFNEIQHVINYTMPKEIEDYVHQIGRTGRSGKTGIATTFVNMNTPEQTLLDLKYLLMEAKQRIPPFLAAIDDPRASAAGGRPLKGCPICGGLGHGIKDCPKLEENQRRVTAGFSRGDGGGGD
ncbi:DEAD-box ATP-dependent RNA helicase 35 [Tilletia horrida]|uniref:RNA helicase n=1 Tax=Tilletia horrida TaxID=155126 RepID=A0AAN6JSH7_9BASI|nr:DEAD-box ATP-dependent RNA helicase 35 [Tilletia horrida]KAK0568251.1 DEAD-box ATP-dependent RNA helicase 35 [Tilletia horrida]